MLKGEIHSVLKASIFTPFFVAVWLTITYIFDYLFLKGVSLNAVRLVELMITIPFFGFFCLLIGFFVFGVIAGFGNTYLYSSGDNFSGKVKFFLHNIFFSILFFVFFTYFVGVSSWGLWFVSVFACSALASYFYILISIKMSEFYTRKFELPTNLR